MWEKVKTWLVFIGGVLGMLGLVILGRGRGYGRNVESDSERDKRIEADRTAAQRRREDLERSIGEREKVTNGSIGTIQNRLERGEDALRRLTDLVESVETDGKR